MKLNKTLEILHRISASFEQESEEYLALENVAHALAFIDQDDVRRRFEEHVRENRQGLTGHMILHLKTMGIEIPDEDRTDVLKQLEKEIDQLAQKINHAAKMTAAPTVSPGDLLQAPEWLRASGL